MNGQDFPLNFPERPCRRWTHSLVKSECGKDHRGSVGPREPLVKGVKGRAKAHLRWLLFLYLVKN